MKYQKKKLNKKYKEHIDNYFIENPNKFKIYENYIKKFFCPNLFLTLDTKFDYKRIKFYEKKIRNTPLKNQAIKLINIYKKQI